jgi:hypothetical protein
MFDVGRSFFILVHSSGFNRICCIQICASSVALKLSRKMNIRKFETQIPYQCQLIVFRYKDTSKGDFTDMQLTTNN